MQRAQNLLITGPCGSGKTYLACALGHNACLHGYTTRYYRLSRLLLAFTQAKADGSYHKLLAQTAKIRLLLIDDWGLEALTTAQRHDLMEIMDDRHGSTSTVMVSQFAYFTAKLPSITRQSCHPFHTKAATHYTAKLPPLRR